MPALTDSNSTVLVTGGNGFVASWIVGVLLKRGFLVRATVRSKERGEHLLETYKASGEKLELCIVRDMQEVSLLPFHV
jgi:nucleoside-diphosphate-sugar epimerase